MNVKKFFMTERFLEAAGSFTSSYFSTPTAASLVLPATLPCWRTIFRYRKGSSSKRRLPIPAQQLPATLRRSGRFPRCRASGLYQVSSMTWRPDSLRSSCRQRRFVLGQFHWIKVGVAAFPALHEGWRALIWKRRIQVSSPDGWALLRANIASHSDAGGTGIRRLQQPHK